MSTKRCNPRRLFKDERGAAIAMVLLIGSVLVMLTGVVVTRGIRQMGNTSGDARWEQALNVAEAGMEYAINERNADSEYATGETVPSFGDRAEERQWAITEAADNPVVATPEGEFAVIVPGTDQVLYSVGYVPARGAEGVRTRVVRREYATARFTTANGLLVGGDADLQANSVIDDPDGENATVYVNGALTIGTNTVVDGCALSAVSSFPETADCPASPVAPAWIPSLRVRPYYAFATTALCPDGTARGGPVHPSFPDPTPDTPCDPADPILPSPDWKFLAHKNSWSAKDIFQSGVIYLYGTNFDGGLGKEPQNKIAEITLLAERSSRSCLVDAGGHISLSAGSYIEYHSSLGVYKTAIMAEGDILYRGGATVIGAVMAGEQIDYSGGPNSWGPVTATDECDTPGSPVSTTVLTGGSFIRFSGELETLLVVGIRPTNWDEM